MYFINLEDLSIKKEFHFETYTYDIPDVLDKGISSIKTIVDDCIKELIDLSKQNKNNPVSLEIIVDGQGEATEEDAEKFVTIVNICTTELLNLLCLEHGRKRDYRLDVPEKLKVVKVSLSSLKKVINSDTYLNQFNFTIKYKDLIYVMVDSKDLDFEKDFKHEVLELENDA